MPSDYVRALNRQADATYAVSSGLQAQANAAMAQAQAALGAASIQAASQRAIAAANRAHDWAKIKDQRAYVEKQADKRETTRYRYLAFRQAVLAANPGVTVDPETLEYLWRNFETTQRTEAQGRFNAMVANFQAQLQSVWTDIAPEIDRLKAVRPLTTSRKFLPVAVILGILTFLLATKGITTFLGTAAILGFLGNRAIKKYREALPDAPAEKTDLALVAAGKALPIAAIFAGWSGMFASMGDYGVDDGSLLGGFAAIGLAIWALVKRKTFYGLETEQANLDTRLAAYNADATWVNRLSFEPWYEQVLREPISLPGTAR